jgi:hypothetical protein
MVLLTQSGHSTVPLTLLLRANGGSPAQPLLSWPIFYFTRR